MPAPTLNSISPAFGPPGAAITCLGAGFDAGAQIGAPSLVPTVFVSAGELRGNIPVDLAGPAGESIVVAVFVRNEDGSVSASLPFTVKFPADRLQYWTTADAVLGEVPGAKIGGNITHSMVQTWMRSVAQSIAGAMLRRGLSLDPAQWQGSDQDTASPAAVGVLELINRLGAAARLAMLVGGQFTQGEWGLAKNLQQEYERELKALAAGDYDKLFRPAAATLESGQQVTGGDIETDSGDAEQAFSKTQVF
jgi:hypothetical protein